MKNLLIIAAMLISTSSYAMTVNNEVCNKCSNIENHGEVVVDNREQIDQSDTQVYVDSENATVIENQAGGIVNENYDNYR